MACLSWSSPYSVPCMSMANCSSIGLIFFSSSAPGSDASSPPPHRHSVCPGNTRVASSSDLQVNGGDYTTNVDSNRRECRETSEATSPLQFRCCTRKASQSGKGGKPSQALLSRRRNPLFPTLIDCRNAGRVLAPAGKSRGIAGPAFGRGCADAICPGSARGWGPRRPGGTPARDTARRGTARPAHEPAAQYLYRSVAARAAALVPPSDLLNCSKARWEGRSGRVDKR